MSLYQRTCSCLYHQSYRKVVPSRSSPLYSTLASTNRPHWLRGTPLCYNLCIAPSYLRDLFKVRNERMTTQSKKYLIQPKVRTTRYTGSLNSLRYDGARIWNKLHNDFKVDDCYDCQRLLKNEIADCNCNTCMFCMIKQL